MTSKKIQSKPTKNESPKPRSKTPRKPRVNTKQLQAELSELNARVACIDEVIAVVELEPSGTIVNANEKFLQLLGYDLGDILGKHHRTLMSPETASSPDYAQFWNEVSNGKSKAVELRQTKKNGEAIWLSASYSCIFDDAGQPEKILEFSSDITATKNAAEQGDLEREAQLANAEFDRNRVSKILEALQSYSDGESFNAIEDDSPDCIGELAKVIAKVINDKSEADAEMSRISAMMEQAPTNVMFADRDLVIQYANSATIKTLRKIESLLPIRADEIVGQCIDIFHKHPAHQRAMLADPSNLPHHAKIKLGPETLELTICAIMDAKNEYVGAMVTWDVITKTVELEKKVKENADFERRRAEETKQKVEVLLQVVNGIAAGNFESDVPELGNDAIGNIATALNSAISSVRSVLGEVSSVASTVTGAAKQLSVATDQIANGAQQQASSLEETASNLESLTMTVKQNTDHAQQAQLLASGSKTIAEKGGDVVGSAVDAMSAINSSSRKIADIIRTIDEIAFQTNLLALNAAVEAARAGEQSRGFAVVAAEVRNLAQRSASAAKEIKTLIEDSGDKVENGTELVNQSGETLNEIVESVTQVTNIVSDIAIASSDQLSSIESVNKAVAQMDQVTQGNASQTEELSGTAQSLLSHSGRLSTIVGKFKLGLGKSSDQYSNQVSECPVSHAAPAMQTDAGLELKAETPASENEFDFDAGYDCVGNADVDQALRSGDFVSF